MRMNVSYTGAAKGFLALFVRTRVPSPEAPYSNSSLHQPPGTESAWLSGW